MKYIIYCIKLNESKRKKQAFNCCTIFKHLENLSDKKVECPFLSGHNHLSCVPETVNKDKYLVQYCRILKRVQMVIGVIQILSVKFLLYS